MGEAGREVRLRNRIRRRDASKSPARPIHPRASAPQPQVFGGGTGGVVGLVQPLPSVHVPLQPSEFPQVTPAHLGVQGTVQDEVAWAQIPPQPSALPQATPPQVGMQVQPEPRAQVPPHPSEAPQDTPEQFGPQEHPLPSPQGLPQASAWPQGTPWHEVTQPGGGGLQSGSAGGLGRWDTPLLASAAATKRS